MATTDGARRRHSHVTAVRNETPAEGLDRNWAHLLQELRVVQTGVQLLTGFLLIVPFQQRFSDLPDFMRMVYLATVVCSMTATVILVAPVPMHRLLFRRGRLGQLVHSSHRFALAGLLFLGLALTGVINLVFYLAAGPWAAAVSAVLSAAAFVALWLVVPLRHRRVRT